MAGLGALELCARLCDDVVLLASVWRVYRKTTPRPSARGVVFAVPRSVAASPRPRSRQPGSRRVARRKIRTYRYRHRPRNAGLGRRGTAP
mmetsp:Transcript_14249/g.50702  ORF Transcript_14249/g.50702 Transcript_14249/m.50702 type:complete len:90 (-) Transcript_14249:469-738(-)